MARDEAYRGAEQLIAQARRERAIYLSLYAARLTEVPESIVDLTELRMLNLSRNKLISLPESIGKMQSLEQLSVFGNQLRCLPDSIAKLAKLESLWLGTGDPGNPLGRMPTCLRQLKKLISLGIAGCELTSLPPWLGELTELEHLSLEDNHLTDLPASLGQLSKLRKLDLDGNPLNPDLAAAHKQGTRPVLQFLRERAAGEVVLHEAKLVLVGEGAVGKSTLLGALRGDEWVENRDSTHGVEIKTVQMTDPDSGTELKLNGWDFGGQTVYRPTHQLFFSAPAVYLVVWKPREGVQQNFVEFWIKLIKHRAGPDAKILVVATHGGPKQRQPDIDQQEIRDKFGADTVLGFFHVDSKPDDTTGVAENIGELKEEIARVAASLPEMGRKVPAKWQRVRQGLTETKKAYLPYDEFLSVCAEHEMNADQAGLFVAVSHTLGHLIHYGYDTQLRDIVILKPDWLAKALSFVLDDKETREKHGLVDKKHLSSLWNDPERSEDDRYAKPLHDVFTRLMARFDLSYRVVDPSRDEQSDTILVAQLVPDTKPENLPDWGEQPQTGDRQQVQICRIVERQSGNTATAEGLFYQLIVRLHKYSLGRSYYEDSVHWQRGLMLDDDYNGRALMELSGNDVRITVRAAYPEFFLFELTKEVKWLVEDFWDGLRCDIMVPCIKPCGLEKPGHGMFEVQKLIEATIQEQPKFPCIVSGCNQWQDIGLLMRNAPAVRPPPEEILADQIGDVQKQLHAIRHHLKIKDSKDLKRFLALNKNQRRLMSQVDERFEALMHTYTDEAKDGPRLFSLVPVEPGFFDRPQWIAEKFRLTLWCEHARQPLPALNKKGDKRGVYDLNMTREWLVKAGPFLKVLSETLSLVLPVATSATKFALPDATFHAIEKQLELGQKSIESVLKGGKAAVDWAGQTDDLPSERGESIRAHGGILRELHAMLREKDPGFGGLVRVQNKRREFLWVHPRFVDEY